jgi:hypothetical protein
VLSLSTLCRAPGAAPSRFVARAHAVGAAALFLDGSLRPDELEALVPEALRTGLAIHALEGPCPRPAARRVPRLASPERDERLAAARLLADTLRRGAELGARAVVVKLGELPGHDASPVLRAFARRELEPETVERLVAARRASSLQALDWARFGLEQVLDAAAAAGVTLALANRARWFEIPSAGEVATLLQELRGAPLAPWYDAAAAHARGALGFGDGRPAVERAAACGAWLTDACGPRVGLPWGTGEVDRERLADLPAGVPRAVHCPPPAADEELAAAHAG